MSALEIVFCGTGWLPMVDAVRSRLPEGASLRVRDYVRPLPEEVAGAHVILPSNAHIDAEAIAAARDLRLIQQPAVGVEVVDLEAARGRGVPVCNAPGANADALAQNALLLILALARRLPEARRAFAERRIGVPLGRELTGKVLGVIGLGKSGSRLAVAAEALGMEVVGVRSTSSREELDALLARADFISLHLPLTPATRGLLGEAELALVKPGACVVNCARGPIIDRDALESALASGRLGGAGLDVFWEEPWDPDDPLFARDDVVTLPHVGGSTVEVFARVADLVAENIRRLMAGEELLHRIV
jgi:phosphoglycerate dehydrogenase-like enzyme